MVTQPGNDLTNHSVILFDGICNLCNGFVQFVIKRDRKGYFHFGSLQSPEAQKLIQRFNLDAENGKTIVLVEDNKIYARSPAVLRVARKLDGPWKLCYAFIVIPKTIRDFVYNFIAERRYKWFGKREQCLVPTPELKERFIDQ